MMKKTRTNKGAFDKTGAWWYEEDIKAFTNASVEQFFGKKKENIDIVTKPLEKLFITYV